MKKKTSSLKPNIKAISIEGYKSLGKETKINIAPLTVLSGINSSGKSSFFQPFLLLKQTKEASFNPPGILLNGPNIQIHESKNIFAETAKGKRTKKVKVGFYCEDGICLKNCYSRKKGFGLNVSEVEFTYGDQKRTFSSKLKKEDEDFLFYQEPSFQKFSESFVKGFKSGKKLGKSRGIRLIPSVEVNRGFFDIPIALRVGEKTSASSSDDTFFKMEGGPYGSAKKYAKSFVDLLHIPGIRGNPERNYKLTATKKRYTGRFEDYTASIIYQWKNSPDKEDKKKLKDLTALLKRLGLTSSINAQLVGDVHVIIEVGALPIVGGAKLSPINIADVGFGVSQVLPILVALLEARKGQVVYIEQPELHLHPQAQWLLAEILADFALKGVTVIFETHSSIMLKKIQTLVAQKKLSKDDVSLNWFSMNKDGLSVVTSADLDNKGRYGDWPQDFDNVILNAESEYLESVYK